MWHGAARGVDFLCKRSVSSVLLRLLELKDMGPEALESFLVHASS